MFGEGRDTREEGGANSVTFRLQSMIASQIDDKSATSLVTDMAQTSRLVK